MAYGLSVIDRVSLAGTTIASNRTFAAALPLANLKTRQLSAIARTNVATDDTVRLDFSNVSGFGANPIVGILANAAASATYNITIKGSTVALGGTDIFSKAYILNRPGTTGDLTRDEFALSLYEYIDSAGEDSTFIRIDIAAEAAQTFDFGRIWIGPSIAATTRHVSLVSGLRGGGSVATSDDGQAFGALGKSLREFEVTVERLTDAEKNTLMRALAYVGNSREFIFMRNTSTVINNATDYHRDNSFYCHREGDVGFSTQATIELNTVTFGGVEER